ncbi:MAG: peptidoglycan DD-metalloendopeptidase family protein [Janthinobacterium lividum]
MSNLRSDTRRLQFSTSPQARRECQHLFTAVRPIACALALLTLAACASRMDGAPVIDRSANAGGALTTGGALSTAPLGPPPPGFYRVKPGDTLYRIALENGQNYRDIASWNNLSNANQIEVDQLLRVAPPGSDAASGMAPGVATAPIGGQPVQTAPLNPPGTSASLGPGESSVPASQPAYVPTPYSPPPSSVNNGIASPPGPSTPPPNAAPGSIALSWPANGPILQRFDETRNKGVDIGGNPGDSVTAAADGRVVYAGNGLRGYGNLIIIKHDSTFLTAYAHNRALSVKEGDAVTRGQKIAEIGNTDASRPMLHFEVRRQGKPVDPQKYLPPR